MHQFVCKGAKTFGISFSKSVLDENVLPLDVSELPQALLKSLNAGFHCRTHIDTEKSDRNLTTRLLCARGKRPCDRCVAQERDKFTPPHLPPPGLKTLAPSQVSTAVLAAGL